MSRENLLKTRLFLNFALLIFCATLVSLFLPSLSEGSCRINDISLEREGDFTKLTIYADQPFEFNHSALESKDGKSNRVIIDCKDAIHSLPQHDFDKSLPPGPIKAIRTSQFQAKPEKIVRIVLDLDKPVVYKVEDKGVDKRGVISILTTQDPNFPFWYAVKNKEDGLKTKSASSSFVGKTNEEKSVTKDTVLTSSENKTLLHLQSSEDVKKEKVKEKTSFEKSLSFADTSETGSKDQVSKVLMAKSETEKGQSTPLGKEKEIKKETRGQTGERMVLATPAIPDHIFTVPTPEEKKLPSKQAEGIKVAAVVNKEGGKSHSPQESVPPPASVKPEKKESFSVSQKEDLEKASPGQTEKKEHLQKESPLSQKESVSSAGKVEKAAEKLPEEKKTDSLNQAAQEEKIALLTPPEKTLEGKEGSPESLIVVPKPEGDSARLVPQREIIQYLSEGRRDPFVPLTERISTELGELPIPTFESLKLVGILRDQAGNRALLEDERGYGYIMKNGDKIKNGYLVSVEDNKVIFQVQEYGWSKAMTLELSNRISKVR